MHDSATGKFNLFDAVISGLKSLPALFSRADTSSISTDDQATIRRLSRTARNVRGSSPSIWESKQDIMTDSARRVELARQAKCHLNLERLTEESQYFDSRLNSL